MNRTARGNRLGLAIVGLALLLAGVAALLRGLGWLPGVLGAADDSVAEQRLRDFAAEQQWFWPVLAVLLVLVALLALRWLAVQARDDTVRRLRLETDARRGSTEMPASAATGALEDDLASSPYVRRAHAGMFGAAARPRLQLSVTMEPTSEPASVLERTYEALDRYHQAMASPEEPASVRLRVGR